MEVTDMVKRSRAGDHKAFRMLFETYYPEAYRTAYLIVRDSQLAEDVVQEAFIKVFRRLETLKEPAKFSGWLHSIVSYCAVDVLNARQNCILVADDISATSDGVLTAGIPSPETETERAELRCLIAKALDGLEPIHRQVIVLRFFREMNEQEIAQAIGCPVGTVKSRLHRALKAIERKLYALRPSTVRGEGYEAKHHGGASARSASQGST